MDTQRKIEHLENRNEVLECYIKAMIANKYPNFMNLAAFKEAKSRNQARIRKLQNEMQ